MADPYLVYFYLLWVFDSQEFEDSHYAFFEPTYFSPIGPLNILEPLNYNVGKKGRQWPRD